jgi:hypothetical protein
MHLEDRVGDALAKTAIQPPDVDPACIIRRAKRRRIAVRVGIPVVILAVTCGIGLGAIAVEKDGHSRLPATGQPSSVVGRATVVETPQHGPQLCINVDESEPPQCSGPDVEGWNWSAVEGEERLAGTTWGTFRVSGTWDGRALTLGDEIPVPASSSGPPLPPDVGGAHLTQEQLAEINAAVGTPTGWIGNGVGASSVYVFVWFDDGELQAQYDQQFGDGAVDVIAILHPGEPVQ